MDFLNRRLSPVFSAVTFGAALLLAGCNEDPEPTNNPPVTEATPMAPGAKTLMSQEGMPQALFLRGNSKGAFVRTDASITAGWAENWEREAQPHEAALIQDPANAALYKNFLAQFDAIRDADVQVKATAVNEAVNKYVQYTPDPDLYGRADYWASPIETLKQKRGDCEDFAILKYYLLKALGVADNRLFIAAVNQGEPTGPNHAVLFVNTAEEGAPQSYIVLDDNESSDIVSTADSNYSIFYTFNDTGYWSYKPDYYALAAAEPVKTENNGRVVEKDGALIIDGGKIVVQKDGSVLVNGPVSVADRQTAPVRAPG